MEQIKEIFPFLLPIITLFIGYVFGQRANKVNRFYSQVENNLKNICEPLFFDLRNIKMEKSSKRREEYIEKLFFTYIRGNSPTYQLGNRYLIEWLLRTEELFKKYKEHRTDENWEIFWIDLEYLHNITKDEYWSGFLTLYREYRWYLYNLRTNYFIGKFFEFIRFGKEIMNFALIIVVLLIFYSYYEKVISKFSNFKPLLPNDVGINLILISLYIIMFNGFLMMIASAGPQWNQKKNTIEKIAESKFNKQVGRSKKFENALIIPKQLNEVNNWSNNE